jgi:hypothetical protein
MKSLVKLMFYLWLVIFSGLAWVTNEYVLSGQIAKNLLCMLAFFGGVAGVWVTVNKEAGDEPA